MTKNDMYVLSTDVDFRNRVAASMISAVVSIYNEGWEAPFHRERQTFGVQVMNSPDTYKVLFASAVATSPAVLSEATEDGSTYLDAANVKAQAAKISDASIDNAVSAMYNTFFRTPGV